MSVEIITFGCRLNTYESEVMKGHALEAGLTDTIIFNTCAVTAQAEKQAKQAIRRARREHPDKRIVVTGCAAQANPAQFTSMAEVNAVLGNEEKMSASPYLTLDSERAQVNDIMSVKETASHLVASFDGRARAFIQVQNGCDHRCTFCIIPFGRGNSRSVPMGEIVTQVRTLVETGYNEIVFTGVDVSAYGADLPGAPVSLDAKAVSKLADRHFGIGCDQLLVLKKSDKADAFMQIFNADGSEISTCGNATRCVADFLMKETGKDTATIETQAGVRSGVRASNGDVQANMGTPRFEWNEIPLSESRNTMHLGLEAGLLMDPSAVNMGNPHAVFFVRDLAHVKMGELGPKLETHPLFPERANISAVQVTGDSSIKMVVWERGTGLTLACGSAACAAVVAGVRRGLISAKCEVELPGGSLQVEWKKTDKADGGDVLMSGAVAYVFTGEIEI
jgi:diaminopimelate epimerase